jgi:hypothetical protein
MPGVLRGKVATCDDGVSWRGYVSRDASCVACVNGVEPYGLLAFRLAVSSASSVPVSPFVLTVTGDRHR